MHSLWTTYRQGMFTTVLQYNDAFDRLKAGCPDLEVHPDAIGLLNWLSIHHVDLDSKDRVYRHLIETSQTDATLRPLASALVFAGLWDGLDSQRMQLRRYFDDGEECVGQIIAEAANQVMKLDTDRVNRVASTLVWNVGREIMNGLKRIWRGREVRISELKGFDVEAEPEESPLEQAEAADSFWAKVARIVGPFNARLLREANTSGCSHDELAKRFRLTIGGVTKRLQRSIQKLRNENPGLLSFLTEPSGV